MNKKQITTSNIETLCWSNNILTDWANCGTQYHPDLTVTELNSIRYGNGFFNSSITSDDGKYVVLYQKFGTKGIILKNGLIIREINRSFYYANDCEYPVCIFSINNRTILAHCPINYNEIVFEDIESGVNLIDFNDSESSDFFHCNFETNDDNTFLISKGWYWHPVFSIKLYNLNEIFNNKKFVEYENVFLELKADICGASFIDNQNILLGINSLNLNKEIINNCKVTIFNIVNNSFSEFKNLNFEIGKDVFVINEMLAWDFYKSPKIFNYKNGDLVKIFDDIFTGYENCNYINETEEFIKILFNKNDKSVAIIKPNGIEILYAN